MGGGEGERGRERGGRGRGDRVRTVGSQESYHDWPQLLPCCGLEKNRGGGGGERGREEEGGECEDCGYAGIDPRMTSLHLLRAVRTEGRQMARMMDMCQQKAGSHSTDSSG